MNAAEYQPTEIQGWMTPGELQWLYSAASCFDSVIEIGSWKGRSTHALCSGCHGHVTAVDHFLGSPEERMSTHFISRYEDLFAQFQDNMRGFKNLTTMRMSSADACEKLNGQQFDLVFIDASHRYKDVKADIKMWKGKARHVICGHDYHTNFPGVMRAVAEEIGPVRTHETIWYAPAQQRTGIA